MGDVDAFDAYNELEKHRGYLEFLALRQLDRRLQSKVDLSGVVQQTLLEAHQASREPSARDSSDRLAWLRRILANNLADAIRKVTTGKHNVYREQSLAEALDQSSAVLEGFLEADVTTPSVVLHREERALQLSKALSHLQPAEREAIVLRNWENRSLAEIGEIIGRTPSAVAGLLKRGLRKLREEFTHFGDSQH